MLAGLDMVAPWSVHTPEAKLTRHGEQDHVAAHRLTFKSVVGGAA
jgi:hypothetical protein